MRKILCLLFLLASFCASAQNITNVSGRVTCDDGPLEGCNVCEIDATGRVLNSTKTDVSGMFALHINNSRKNKLQFSCEGFLSQTLDIKNRVLRVGMQRHVQKETTVEVEAVDLGLSVKWASCNIGANAPEELGLYLSWGELEEKDEYYWSSTENYDKCLNYTKYDAAAELWRERWQMPTNFEAQELISRCVWTWHELNGVKGFYVTGPSGKSIFLPAWGFRDGSDLKESGVTGCYWTASPYDGMDACAYGLMLSQTQLYRGHRTRSFGFQVRPVWK